MTIISPLVLSFYTEVKSVGKLRSLSQGCTWLVRVKASPYSKVWDFRDALTKLPASGRGWAWAICHLSLSWEIVLVCSGCTTQYHRLGGLSHRNLFLSVLETGCPRSNLDLLISSEAWGWPPSCSLFPGLSVCARGPLVSPSVSNFLFS